MDAALIGATAVLAGMVMALGCQKIYGYDIPPFPKSYRHASGVTQGAGAQRLLFHRRIKAPLMRGPLLESGHHFKWFWCPNEGNPASNVVFILLSSDRLLPYRSLWTNVEAVTTNQVWPLLIDKTARAKLFIVKASNIVSGEISQ